MSVVNSWWSFSIKLIFDEGSRVRGFKGSSEKKGFYGFHSTLDVGRSMFNVQFFVGGVKK